MNRTYIDTPLQIVEATEVDTGSLPSEHDLDVLNVRFKLVYAGVNNNGDRLTESILRDNYRSLLYKFINWEHDEPNIGVITSARLVEATSESPTHVECDGVIMKLKYPEYAQIVEKSAGMPIVEASDKTYARMSMEAVFHDADYIIGEYEQVVPMKNDRTGVLESMLGKTLGGKLVSRELKDCVFTGAAVTVNPAEKRAVLVATASNKSDDGREVHEELPDNMFAMASRRVFPIDTAARSLASYEYFDEVASLISEEYETVPELVEAHRIVQDSLADNGLSDLKHNCRICQREGGTEDMASKTKKVEASEEVVEVAPESMPEIEEALDDTTVVEANEVTTEPEALDEPSQEPEEDLVVEDVIEAGPEPETSTEDDDAPSVENETFAAIKNMLTDIQDAVNALKPEVVMASDNDRTDEELLTAKARAVAAEDKLLGFKRAVSLASEGLTAYASLEDKAARYGQMDNNTWVSYVQDLREIKASETKDRKPIKASKKADDEESVLILESVDEDPVDKYRSYVMSIKR
jgi:hypothetical protein